MFQRYLFQVIVVLLPLTTYASGRTYISNGFFMAATPTASVEAAPQVTVSEVTSSAPPAPETESPQAVRTSLRPEARPAGLNTQRTAAPAGTPNLFDMRGCTYGRGSSTSSNCYGSMSTVNRARRIMNAVNYINRLHETQFDGRYMLCTGFRESNFNPGARGADGERGMFQVMTATGRAALRYGVELPDFKQMNSENYMNRMANSTIAQVELSFLVLKMKLAEAAAGSSTTGRTLQTRIMSGNGSVDHYRTLAGKYNGGGYNSTYARRISTCYNCLRGKMTASATNIGTEIQSCLNQAK